MQLYCALLYNAHVRGFVEGEIYKSKAPTTKGVCVPGFNCYSCPGAVGACPLGSLQNAIGTSSKQTGYYVFGILMLYGLILGRTICGWLCPLGLIQELLHKIPTPKLKKNRVTRALSYLKYVILAVFVVGITAWYGIAHGVALPAFCKYICPAGTSEGAIFLLSNPANANDFSMLNILFTRKFVIMLVIGLACVFCYRSFCRFLCPLGAIYGLFSKVALVGVKVDATRCKVRKPSASRWAALLSRHLRAAAPTTDPIPKPSAESSGRSPGGLRWRYCALRFCGITSSIPISKRTLPIPPRPSRPELRKRTGRAARPSAARSAISLPTLP